jgi:hypothetical protein
LLKTVDEKDPKQEEELKDEGFSTEAGGDRTLNPYSMMFHSKRGQDENEREFMDTREINILDLDFTKIPGVK